MQRHETITMILSVLTALGGFGFVQFLMNRRWEKQRLSTENRSSLEETQRRQVDWLERRINERDKRIDSIFHELRQEQKSTVELLKQLHLLQLQLNEEQRYRCFNQDCTRRKSEKTTIEKHN